MKNIELKLKLSSFNEVKRLARAVGARDALTMSQVDTYFVVPEGRLRLREINSKKFELIKYFRADVSGSRLSDYQVIVLNKKEAVLAKKILAKIFGVKVVVKKKRNLWLYRHTRIHFDTVAQLGKYLELETVVRGSGLVTLQKEHQKIIELLGLKKYKKIKMSYNDLLLDK